MSVTLTHLHMHLLFSFNSLFILGKSIEHALVKQSHASQSHCGGIHIWELPITASVGGSVAHSGVHQSYRGELVIHNPPFFPAS